MIHWSCGPEYPATTGAKVEADEDDHRTGDAGGRIRWIRRAPLKCTEGRQRQHDAGDQDRAGDVGRVATLGPDRGDTGHERGAGAQVAGTGAGISRNRIVQMAGEHDREVGVEPMTIGGTKVGQDRDHVLRAEAGGPPQLSAPHRPDARLLEAGSCRRGRRPT